jgi:hypothetical protein
LQYKKNEIQKSIGATLCIKRRRHFNDRKQHQTALATACHTTMVNIPQAFTRQNSRSRTRQPKV